MIRSSDHHINSLKCIKLLFSTNLENGGEREKIFDHDKNDLNPLPLVYGIALIAPESAYGYEFSLNNTQFSYDQKPLA